MSERRHETAISGGRGLSAPSQASFPGVVIGHLRDMPDQMTAPQMSIDKLKTCWRNLAQTLGP
jgi:hypothetical protein